MKNKALKYFLFVIAFFAIIWFVNQQFSFFSNSIDYNTDVKPILNKHCIACHGGVKQSSGFSLMNRELALRKNDSGKAAIIPGDPHNSEMIKRILSQDPEERMPLEGDALSQEEIAILSDWIDQGAEWGLHWAYQPLTEEKINGIHALSSISGAKEEGPSEVIDHFVKEKLSDLELDFSPPAEKAALLRRLSFDIIGMPAPRSLQKQFLAGEFEIESFVDSLLAMDSYGEKWATMWLDIARYADSRGFERDENRSIWAFRDYVIKAFNKDKPFDQFVIEQMAGDLLENPTEEQYIATGFHRNTTTNDEGGTDNEEYRVKAVMDRVATTWEGFMGTTMACVQCHGHPYDPFPHEEYYQSYAFLNNTRDADTYGDYPILQFLDTLGQEKLDKLKNWVEKVANREVAEEMELFVKTVQPVIYSIETKDLVDADLYDTKFLGLRKNGRAVIPKVKLEGKTRLIMRAASYVDGGELTLQENDENGAVLARIALNRKEGGYHLMELPLETSEGQSDVFLHYKNPSWEEENRPGVQFDWFWFTNDFPGAGDREYDLNKERFRTLVEGHAKSKHTLIFRENPEDLRRKTHVFDRGNWLVEKEEVQADVPSIFPPIPDGQEKNRLAFAEWIVSTENPLTARTFVNRIWEQIFGQGIVSTTEDLGSQGAIPSHPALLDYLAYQWMHDQNWSIKSLIKRIVLSKSYQQTARATELALEKDPYNIYLSRGPRVRLSAEQMRDQALFVSGLLNPKMYGPSVMPFQPEGVWNTPYNGQSWTLSENGDQYRRGLYTMIKRSSLYPAMETFDMAERQVCESRRIRTNTPLQALVTLNDPAFMEAAEHLAKRMMEEGGEDLKQRINFAYQLGMSKDIEEGKLEVLEGLYEGALESLQADKMVKNDRRRDAGLNDAELNDAELNALSVVANAILNLDEMLNR